MPDLKFLRHKRAKGRDYWYFDTGQVNDRGKPILTPLPPKRSLEFGGAYARAVAARTMRVQRRGYLSLDELVRRYEKSPEFAGLSENSRTSYSRYLAVANKLIRGKHGESPPAASLEPRDVLRLRDRLADSPGAASQTVRVLGALYAWASDPAQGYAPANPATKVKLFKSGEHQPWPEALLDLALGEPQIALAVALLYFTGQRIGDVVRMQWSDIGVGEIRVLAQKTKSRLRIPIAAELASLLSATRRRSTAILTNADGRPWSASGLRQKLQGWAKEHGEKVVPHGLRKNAVNALFEAGCTAAEVSAITAHSLQMLEHYGKQRNQPRIGRAAIIKLEDARRRRNGTGK
jgi:integrase